jgi:predicted nucleic acid-binding protein
LAGVFVDSGAWIALSNPQDQFRSTARSYFQSIGKETKLVTSNYVIQEAVTNLVYSGLRRYVPAFREMLAESEKLRWLDIVWVTPELHEDCWGVLERFADQSLSFTDCSSIAICRTEGIDTAFSFDRHFAVAGLITVPGT